MSNLKRTFYMMGDILHKYFKIKNFTSLDAGTYCDKKWLSSVDFSSLQSIRLTGNTIKNSKLNMTANYTDKNCIYKAYSSTESVNQTRVQFNLLL